MITNHIRMRQLLTDEFRLYNEIGKMLLTRGRERSQKETVCDFCTILWPPVYRSPFFPVFFDAGTRKYNKVSISGANQAKRSSTMFLRDFIYEKVEQTGFHHIDIPPPALPVDAKRLSEISEVAELARQIHLLGDDIGSQIHFFPPPTIMSDIVTRFLNYITFAAPFLLEIRYFLRYFIDLIRHRIGSLLIRSHLQVPQDCFRGRRKSSCPSRSHSTTSLSKITSEKNEAFPQAESLPDMLLKSNCEEFTPEVTADEMDESYRFQSSRPGLYQCSVTGLVFHMQGEGDVVYRIVPWNKRLLAQHHQQPAGPLFDIKCVQQSVCQLHLPHCEIRSTGGSDFLSVAHVHNEVIEFIAPHKITETHVIINITGFSGFGAVKEMDSPPDPVRALVLLFYRAPADPELESLLNVLLLPKNVVLRDVLRSRKKLVGDESYIETSPHCKLLPKQEYTLSTCPEDDSVLVQPTEAEFDCDNYDNYFPSFQVSWETVMKHMKLCLRQTNSSHSVWERRVCLSSTGVGRPCGPSALDLPPNERLLDIRSSFIDGISGPVLKSLLDKLLEKRVMADSERETADVMQNKRDKARFVIDSVRKKGKAASSEMIEFLCEADPFLCEHLGLI